MKPWKTLQRKTIHHQPPWLEVEQHIVELPDGRVISDWPWIRTPDYINIVTCTRQDTFLCFRQTKYGIGGPTLAIVGGYLQPDEEPLAAAQRELREETGYAAGEWIDLGNFLVDPNRGIATGHLFLARQAFPIGDPIVDDLEEQELIELSRRELEQALDNGEFKILAWAACVSFALRKIDR
jgi:8-oxo-dGTP pyrophosphatase MutT (NUDIX family)